MPNDRDAQKALSLAARIVATAPATPSARLHALQKMADHLRQYVQSGWLNPATGADKIFEVAELHGLSGEPGSDKEAAIMQIAMSANLPSELHLTARSNDHRMPTQPSLETKTPAAGSALTAASLTRDTASNVQKAGFRLSRVENVYLDVIKIIRAAPDLGM